MQGFGVNTYRLVNADGQSTFVKFHWSPKAGTHSLVWDEAVKISGADPDFHRRDLWEAIEAGAYPEYELGVQIITEEQAEGFSFDVLDATKIVPEELVPVQPIGRMLLTRNPDNFFAETEQVAFCVAHVVPGVDFSNDPLLAGRIHSYVDTQISRLGGPNFHEIPINAPVAQVHNNQREGMHRQAIHRGRVNYEPNSLAGGCPFQAGKTGFVSYPEPRDASDHKVRAKPERMADHYTQARLFWNSQTAVEKRHIVNAFRFELSKVQTPAVRERMVAGLMNVDSDLANGVAQGLGLREMPPPLPKVRDDVTPEVNLSPTLSLFARPGKTGVQTRRVAVLAGDGSDVDAVLPLIERLTAEGAVARIVGSRLGDITTAGGDTVEIDVPIDAAPSVLWDAAIITSGTALKADGRALEFVKDTYRHCKPILAVGSGAELLEEAGVPPTLPHNKKDPGLLFAPNGEIDPDRFVAALAAHRHFDRESDPPLV